MEAKAKTVVTFLLGNGFDVGMGMKSQYVDFYRVYTDKKSPYYPKNNDYLAKKIASDKIKQTDHWSSYEEWFGDLTQKSDWKKKIKPDDLLKRHEEFQQYFYKYLKEQEAGLIFTMADSKIKNRLLKDLGREMLSALRKFYDATNILDGADQIRPLLNAGGIDIQIEYQFICFNYSSVLDQCVDAMKAFLEELIEGILTKSREAREAGKDIDLTESELDIFVEKDGYDNFKWFVNFYAKEGFEKVQRSRLENRIKIGSVHHGHGELKNPEQTVLVMGVNDDSQAGDEFRWRQNKSRSNRLIKKNIMISNQKERQWNTTMNMIEQSDIIVVYGMSIGGTDRDYWKKLYDWLVEDPNHQLIFYRYERSFDSYDPHQRNEIVGAQEKNFREMTWKIDSKQKRCRINNQSIFFTEHNCPNKFTCEKEKCNCVSLAQWCQANGLCDSKKNCNETDCPYNQETNRYSCRSWRKIRKQIHFAIQKNIFEYDLVISNYYPAMMYHLILNEILKDAGNGTWFLGDKEIAKMDGITLRFARDAAVARVGLKLYYLFTKLIETVGYNGLVDAAYKAGNTIDTSSEIYQTSREWLKEERKRLEDLGADLKNYQKTAKVFTENLKKAGVCGKGQADKIADFYNKVLEHWEKIQ